MAILEAVRGADQYVSFLMQELDITQCSENEHRSSDSLLDTPFAQKLFLLIGVVRGEADAPPEAVREYLGAVLRSLFASSLTSRTDVPDAFWSATLIGRHLARARLLLHRDNELVSLNEIIQQVGIPKGRVENILAALAAERLYDPEAKRWLYLREAIASVARWNVNESTSVVPLNKLEGDPSIVVVPMEEFLLHNIAVLESRQEFERARLAYQRRHFAQP